MGRLGKTFIAWAVWTLAVVAGVIVCVPPAIGFANPGAARIVIIHVPCAILAVAAYVVSTIYAIAHLAKGRVDLDIKSSVSAGLGFAFTVLATLSGMVFAKLEWGAAWNWDPRETTILMLLIVYAAYFTLRSAIPGRQARARVGAVYNILACVVMPYLVFVLPRLLGGLHPTDTLTSGGLSPEYRIAISAAALSALWLYVLVFRSQVAKLITRGKK
ncbi:cytochrome c biogenesis protein [bacterium]|nr:cytochrome c biogenesis protein [bacterium]